MPKSKKPPSREKVKNPRVERNHRYSIDFGEKFIRIIAVNKAGKIVKAGRADAPELPEAPDAAYMTALAKAVKQAKRAAKVPRSLDLPCVLTTGGPHIIKHRFIWPDMPPTALRSNAANEIAGFLPADSDEFLFSQRVVRRYVATENNVPKIDVVVAAMSAQLAGYLSAAARKAGFAPVRLDIHENARNKLTQTVRVLPQPDNDRTVPASYAVLDLNGELLNISLYLNGVFYSNRYFSSFTRNNSETTDENPIEKPIEEMFDIIKKKASTSPETETVDIDTDSLASEVSSIIDFMQYRERGTQIECILLYGDEKKFPNIMQSFADHMEIPVYKTDEWLKPDLFGKKIKNVDYAAYLDAYGASISSLAAGGLPPKMAADLDLRPPKKKNIVKQLLPPVACTAIILGAAIYFGVTIPNDIISSYELEIDKYELELAGYTVSARDIDAINGDIDTMRRQINEIDTFFTEWPRALAVVPAITKIEQQNQFISNLNVSGGTASIGGQADNFDFLAASVVKLQDNNIFSGVKVNSANSAETEDEFGRPVTKTTYNVTIGLKSGTGAR